MASHSSLSAALHQSRRGSRIWPDMPKAPGIVTLTCLQLDDGAFPPHKTAHSVQRPREKSRRQLASRSQNRCAPLLLTVPECVGQTQT